MKITVQFGNYGDDSGWFKRSLGGEAGEVQIEADTVREVLSKLIERTPEAKILVDDEGKLRKIFAVFVDEEDIRFLQGLNTPVTEGGEMYVIPMICSLFYELIQRELTGYNYSEQRTTLNGS